MNVCYVDPHGGSGIVTSTTVALKVVGLDHCTLVRIGSFDFQHFHLLGLSSRQNTVHQSRDYTHSASNRPSHLGPHQRSIITDNGFASLAHVYGHYGHAYRQCGSNHPKLKTHRKVSFPHETAGCLISRIRLRARSGGSTCCARRGSVSRHVAKLAVVALVGMGGLFAKFLAVVVVLFHALVVFVTVNGTTDIVFQASTWIQH